MLAIGAAVLLLPTVAMAQAPHRVSGRLTDRRGDPVVGATIQVTGTLWRTLSRSNGRFDIAIPGDSGRLEVTRLGYRPAVRPVASGDTVPIVLDDAPSELRGILVTDERAAPLGTAIAAGTVRQVPALGEPDIFHLLPAMPFVSKPNDLIGRLHLVGGASDEHAIYLDGHPLQAPFHVLSVLGAFNIASLERADVEMLHVRSARDGHVSGSIDLQTRRPSPRPQRAIDVSLISASLTASQPSLIEGVSALGSARLTYLDRVIAGFIRSTGSSDDLSLPTFGDVLLRLGREWQTGWSVELLGYGTLDQWGSSGGSRVIPPRWSEGMVGVRAVHAGGDWLVSSRLSVDQASLRFREFEDTYIDSTLQRIVRFIDVRQRWSSAAIDARRAFGRWSAAFGMGVDARSNTDRWAHQSAKDWLSPQMPSTLDTMGTQTIASAFGEVAVELGPRWSATLGSHLSRTNARTFLAPRFVLALRATDAIRVELAADRRHQFDAVVEEPQEGSIAQPVFLLRKPRVAELVALRAAWDSPREMRGGAAIGLEIAAFARRDRDRTLLESAIVGTTSSTRDPASPFPTFRRIPGRAIGASISGHLNLRNGTTVQGSYSAQRVTERVDAHSDPVDWSVPHSATVLLGVPIASRWTLTGAAQAHSGAAVTPIAERIFVPQPWGAYSQRYLYGARNSARLPTYVRVDLGVRRAWRAWSADWALSLQVINVLARTNLLQRNWAVYFACARGFCSEFGTDRRGLPVLPSIGLEVRW